MFCSFFLEKFLFVIYNVVDMKKESLKETKKKIAKQKAKKDKEKYFEYYDDVKHFSKGKEDW